MTEVAFAYYVDRAATISLAMIMLVFYLIQFSSELFPGWSCPRGSVQWVSHRIGVFASVSVIIFAVDSFQVFGIYTLSNKLCYWFMMLSISSMFAMVFSLCYTVISTHARTARQGVSRWFKYGLLAMGISMPLFITLLMIDAYVTQKPPLMHLYFLWMAIIGLTVCGLFGYHGWHLRQVLQANLNNPQLTKMAQRAYTKINHSLFGICFALTCAILYALVRTFQVWDDASHFIGDPQKVDGSKIVMHAFMILGLLLQLWIVWIPMRFACGAGPYHLPYTFLHVSGAANDESDGLEKRKNSDQAKDINNPMTPGSRQRDPSTSVNTKTGTGSHNNGKFNLQIRVDNLPSGSRAKSTASTPLSAESNESVGHIMPDAEPHSAGDHTPAAAMHEGASVPLTRNISPSSADVSPIASPQTSFRSPKPMSALGGMTHPLSTPTIVEDEKEEGGQDSNNSQSFSTVVTQSHTSVGSAVWGGV